MVIATSITKKILNGALILGVLTLAATSYGGLVTPHRQGFHCSDPELGYRYQVDSISYACVVLVTFLAPLFFIFLIECKRHRPYHSLRKTSDVNPSTSKEKRLKSFWSCCFQVYWIYIQGIACAGSLLELLKISVGGLRPYFFDSCKPDFSLINCSQGYITQYNCTNEQNLSTTTFFEIFKSFPSGHATASTYMSVFLCIYIYKQIFPWPTYLSVGMLQTLLLFWAGYCSVSRIIDHKHHWWDVLGGMTLGLISSCYSATWLWLNRLPCCIEMLSSSKNSLFSSKHDFITKIKSPRRMLLSSQASQTTELGESLSFQNNVQETFHDSV